MMNGNDDEYRPHDGEEFMNPRQLAWFRQHLIDWREDILSTSSSTLVQLGAASLREPDVADRAASESDWSRELRARDRQRKLLSKITGALRRIDEGDYGYCDITGEPIALQRLIARPVATMTVEAQEAHERNERISRAA